MANTTTLPIEVELIYQVLPCNAMRVAQESGSKPHACAYFRKWGTYHSFDYVMDGAPPEPGIPTKVKYVGRAPLLPEALSGCRKAPILGIGINPNLPGWFAGKRGALNPQFDDYRQYAHYFRHRSTAKLIVPKAAYEAAGGGAHDTPFSDFSLDIATNGEGDMLIEAELDEQTFYKTYQKVLDDLAAEMDWTHSKLKVGEDLAYMNMVACPSAKWITSAPAEDPKMPPMTPVEKKGIVSECFRERRYFKRQLVQSLPKVLWVISQSTARAFLEEMQGNFTVGDPKPTDHVEDLLDQDIRLRYGTLEDGTDMEAKVIFSPHITGNPAAFAAAWTKIMAQFIAAAREGLLTFNEATGHLSRSRGSCVLCPMLEIGKCDYTNELEPVALRSPLEAAGPMPPEKEKAAQLRLLGQMKEPTAAPNWEGTDE